VETSINNLSELTPRQQTLVEFFRNSPLVEAELDLERVPDYGRDISMEQEINAS
jgi:hypothetical protein